MASEKKKWNREQKELLFLVGIKKKRKTGQQEIASEKKKEKRKTTETMVVRLPSALPSATFPQIY